MNATTKKTISYFEGILGMTLAVLCAITLRFAIWEPELLQKIFLTIFGLGGIYHENDKKCPAKGRHDLFNLYAAVRRDLYGCCNRNRSAYFPG